jgi:hypothetical protein
MPPTRAALALCIAALAFSSCSGLPPDTLVPLERGQAAMGLNVAVDLRELRRPDVAGWFGIGLGEGVDVGIGLDVPLGLLAFGPRVGYPLGRGSLPGLVLRKTWANGVGVGVGTSTRTDFSLPDSLGLVALTTAGPFVTIGPRPGSWDDGQGARGRVTAYVGYAQVRTDRSIAASGLAAHVGAQLGTYVSSSDSSLTFAAVRAQSGVVLLPRPALLHGPTVGATFQDVQFPGLRPRRSR